MLTQNSWLLLCGVAAFTAAFFMILVEHHEEVAVLNFIILGMLSLFDVIVVVSYYIDRLHIPTEYWKVRNVVAGVQLGVLGLVAIYGTFYPIQLILGLGSWLITKSFYSQAITAGKQ